jgi:hypothetical protein
LKKGTEANHFKKERKRRQSLEDRKRSFENGNRTKLLEEKRMEIPK